MSTSSAWRSASAVRIVLVATLAAAAFLAAYGLVNDTSGDSTSAASSESASAAPDSDSADPSAAQAKPASFTSASAGACLTWSLAADGSASGFEQVSCGEPHRFEVSTREDLSAYPTSEFGPNAERPDVTRQNALREELCESPTVSYLEGLSLIHI